MSNARQLLIGSMLAGITFAAATQPTDNSRDAVLERGERVYGSTCATGYCHTRGGGSGGGAARLAARGFDLAHIQSAVTNGMPQTRMPAFGTMLPAEDLNAVIAYVAALNDIDATSGVAATAPARPVLSATAATGRSLFHAAERGFGRCATCHQIAGSGVPVADPIGVIPTNAAALRKLQTPDVGTATLAGERMPALVISPGATRTMFYDLTVPPPVLRTAPADAFKVVEGSGWRHAKVIEGYSDQELESVLIFLREVTR